MHMAAGALITWKNGRPRFTAAGHEHYAAACKEAHIAFEPQALLSAADLRRFLRTLLQASVALRKQQAARASAGPPPLSPLQLLAREALREVAQSAARSPGGLDTSAHAHSPRPPSRGHHRVTTAPPHG